MAVSSHVPPNTVLKLLGNVTTNVNLTTDTIAAGLCTGSSATWTTGTIWAYKFAADITGAYTEVVTGGGYTSGYANRQALTTFTFAVQAATNDNIVSWTCTSPNPISFGSTTTITAHTLFFYDKTANGASSDANSWVLATVDFGGSVVSTAGAFTYTVAAAPNGLAYWTCS